MRQTATVTAAIASIPEQAWVDIDYPDGGREQVAETTLSGDRLIVRCTCLTGPQASLWPDWRHHAFVTDRTGSAGWLDADHRHHAVCELAIRDLKDGAGASLPLGGVPGQRGLAGHCGAGARPASLGGLHRAGTTNLVVAKTLRRRLFAMPGRLTRSARRRLLHLPRDWPRGTEFLAALARLQAVPLRA